MRSARTGGNYLIGALAISLIATSTQAALPVFSTIAGTPGDAASASAYDDGTNGMALFDGPSGIAVDSAGNLYIADQYHCDIRKATRSGTNWVVTTIAGSPGQFNFAPPIVNGTNAHALFYFPTGVAVDANSNIYVADQYNYAIRKITPQPGATNWVVTTVAGNGNSGSANGTNSQATFSDPVSVAVDANTNLFVADQNNSTIRKITPIPGTTNWVVTTIAGLANNLGNNNGIGTNASFYNPSGVAVDLNGNVYVADQGNNIIRLITPVTGTTNWSVSTIAGNPAKVGSSDGTNGSALFDNPAGVALDTNGNIFVADQNNQTIRKIVPVGTNWVVTTIGGQPDISGTNDAYGTNALFNYPSALAVDSAGNIYVADTQNETLRLGAPPANPLLTGMAVSNGSAQFTVNAQPGASCLVQFSADFLAWSPLVTNTIPPGGSQFFADPAPATDQMRFYRAVLP